jgi:hypothetical protein
LRLEGCFLTCLHHAFDRPRGNRRRSSGNRRRSYGNWRRGQRNRIVNQESVFFPFIVFEETKSKTHVNRYNSFCGPQLNTNLLNSNKHNLF